MVYFSEEERMEKKRIFVKKLKSLRSSAKQSNKKDNEKKPSTYKSIAEAFSENGSEDTVKKWFSESDKTIPKIDVLFRICKEYHVDLNYLFEEDKEDFNDLYAKITELTGLSSKAIRVLAMIQERYKNDTKKHYSKQSDQYSKCTTDLINLVLEDAYQSWASYDLDIPLESVFRYIYEAIHDTNLIPLDGSKEPVDYKNKLEEITVNDLIYFDEKASVGMPPVSTKDIYHAYTLNKITNWIEDKKAGRTPIMNHYKGLPSL